MLNAAEMLQNEYQIDSEVYVTSFSELRKNGMEVERYNLLHQIKRRKSLISRSVW